jgi:hypothetical protein
MSCLFFVSLRKEVFPFLSFVVKRLFGVHRLHWRQPKKGRPFVQPSQDVPKIQAPVQADSKD